MKPINQIFVRDSYTDIKCLKNDKRVSGKTLKSISCSSFYLPLARALFF